MRRNLLCPVAAGIFIRSPRWRCPFPSARRVTGETFSARCTLCDVGDGSGSSPTGKALKAKDLKSEEVQKASDEDLTTIITNGKGKMPAFGKKLKPEDIQALVVYVRTLAKK